MLVIITRPESSIYTGVQLGARWPLICSEFITLVKTLTAQTPGEGKALYLCLEKLSINALILSAELVKNSTHYAQL